MKTTVWIMPNSSLIATALFKLYQILFIQGYLTLCSYYGIGFIMFFGYEVHVQTNKILFNFWSLHPWHNHCHQQYWCSYCEQLTTFAPRTSKYRCSPPFASQILTRYPKNLYSTGTTPATLCDDTIPVTKLTPNPKTCKTSPPSTITMQTTP